MVIMMNDFKSQIHLTAQLPQRKPLKLKFLKNVETSNQFIKVVGARENNLKNIRCYVSTKHALTVVTGVSGSGKSSLIKKDFISFHALQKKLAMDMAKKQDNSQN